MAWYYNNLIILVPTSGTVLECNKTTDGQTTYFLVHSHGEKAKH